MEFKEAMRIYDRICKGRDVCEACVLEGKCIGIDDCDHSETEAILIKWAEEHPERTRLDDFLDKHPKAKRSDDGTPTPCAESCGYIDKCNPGEMSCADCWRRPLEEV